MNTDEARKQAIFKAYLGDGVYADYVEGYIRVFTTTTSGLPDKIIWLAEETKNNLLEYIVQLGGKL